MADVQLDGGWKSHNLPLHSSAGLLATKATVEVVKHPSADLAAMEKQLQVDVGSSRHLPFGSG